MMADEYRSAGLANLPKYRCPSPYKSAANLTQNNTSRLSHNNIGDSQISNVGRIVTNISLADFIVAPPGSGAMSRKSSHDSFSNSDAG